MYIVKNTSNTVVERLADKATSSGSDWLFEFTNGIRGNPKKYCSAVDISSYFDAYSEFIIIDNPTEDPSNGTLNFFPTGSWKFKIYEMPVASPPSLTPTGYLAIVKEGDLKVYDPNETDNKHFNGDNQKSSISFKG